MKKILLCVIGLWFFLVPLPVRAEEGWVIADFHSDIALQSDGAVRIEETITVDFNALEKHGIFRDLPYVYKSNGSKHYTEIKDISVMRNGQGEPFGILTNDANWRIKIGDPHQTVTGRQTYQISYNVVGVLSQYSNYDEFYWNVTGNDWGVPIEQASATINLPKVPESGIVQISCYVGSRGSTNQCQSNQTSDSQATFVSPSRLGSGEGLTIAIGYTKNLVPVITAQPPLSQSGAKKFVIPLMVFLGSVVGIGGILIFLSKFRFHRDEPTTIVPEFSPPDNLKPGELGIVIDTAADTIDITATIVDLANRGYLTVVEIPKKWLFGLVDYELTRTDKSSVEFLGYESLLVKLLFKDGLKIRLSDLKNSFYKDLDKVETELENHAIAKNWLMRAGGRTTKSLWPFYIGLGVLISGIPVLFIGAFTQIAPIMIVGFLQIFIGVFSCVVLMAWSATFRRTVRGREIYAKTLGYKLFLETTERYRQRFLDKENLFTEILPYAMVFGLTQKLAKAFEQMGVQPSQPTWYVGQQPFNAIVFSQSMNNFSSTLSSAMASKPSSSGSGGGGFSGGGFGGGGGGSW